ncbi:MAG: SAM-dependent chlorinase/fluorinase [Gammaproteobacteria bacterium]|uniref:SAM-dependent chlorinase/fluorinase n=1 Tax=Candidatus Thiopontia autotrophica TaxID=2841688 RepID=A0A8J6P6F6_9GAMM|nr:SAM-dependent chlorinase/fluorinase [Candidatus Thiopontia autotrophica]MBL6969087.1 SAM-dependent chlorinase/fluorinase [Gammaproteobacteria bacterium]
MIILVTDFGVGSPYLAQMRSALFMHSADGEIVDLVSDLAPFNIEAASHFLVSHVPYFPKGTIFLSVVDPGVGGKRRAVVLHADGNWFIGPENGIFDQVTARAESVSYFQIMWEPDHLSNTFHGRDLFAPIAAKISSNTLSDGDIMETILPSIRNGSHNLHKVIYLDRYGNAITGVRAGSLSGNDTVVINGVTVRNSATFSDRAIGEPFWYDNSVGLLEIAVNQGSARDRLDIEVGTAVSIITE